LCRWFLSPNTECELEKNVFTYIVLHLSCWPYLFHDSVPWQETTSWMHSCFDTSNDRTTNKIFKKWRVISDFALEHRFLDSIDVDSLLLMLCPVAPVMSWLASLPQVQLTTPSYDCSLSGSHSLSLLVTGCLAWLL
jgi:hypothetical protein